MLDRIDSVSSSRALQFSKSELTVPTIGSYVSYLDLVRKLIKKKKYLLVSGKINGCGALSRSATLKKGKKISIDQELKQSDPTSRP